MAQNPTRPSIAVVKNALKRLKDNSSAVYGEKCKQREMRSRPDPKAFWDEALLPAGCWQQNAAARRSLH